MKTKIRILLISGIIITMASNSCDYYDSTTPGLFVYKTKGDYFYYVPVRMNRDGKLYAMPDYHHPKSDSISGRIIITEDDTVYARRVKLIDGYILDAEVAENSVFVDFTHKEYLEYEINHPDHSGIPASVLENNILDDDPFLELYYDSNRPRKYSLLDSFSDTVMINQLIRDGELKKDFRRIK